MLIKLIKTKTTFKKEPESHFIRCAANNINEKFPGGTPILIFLFEGTGSRKGWEPLLKSLELFFEPIGLQAPFEDKIFK